VPRQLFALASWRLLAPAARRFFAVAARRLFAATAWSLPTVASRRFVALLAWRSRWAILRVGWLLASRRAGLTRGPVVLAFAHGCARRRQLGRCVRWSRRSRRRRGWGRHFEAQVRGQIFPTLRARLRAGWRNGCLAARFFGPLFRTLG
jgi:hypothetical protein